MQQSRAALCLLAAILTGPLSTDATVHAADCVVTNTSDSAAGTPPTPDSLRDCLSRARSGDTITFDSTIFDLTNSDAATTIHIDDALPDLDDSNVTLDASNRRVTVNGSGTVDTALRITSSSNAVKGLTLTGFTGSAIVVSGASNVIGGDRSVGGGPNGQGLRLGASNNGLEIAGAGASHNVVKGCWIGLDAAGASSEPNLAAGVLIADGAEDNTIGGDNPEDANAIGFNGGNGVEVRASGSKRNAMRGNRITANKRGGIALFDGSNDGVRRPTIEKIVQAPPSGTGPKLLVSGTTTGDGTVEIFNDAGSQGETLLGRGSYATSHFEMEIDGSDGFLKNVTATFTDAAGNTSPFGLFGVTGDEDTDGDGFPDELEVALGTSPNDPLSAPVLAGPLTASKLGIKLNFAKANADAIGLKTSVTLPPGVPLAGTTIGVWIARHHHQLVLDDKGKAVSSDKLVAIALKTSSKTGVTTLQYKVKKSALEADLGPLGLDDRTTDKAGETVVVPFMMTTSSAVGSSIYNGLSVQTYKAKQGKSGKASNSK